MLLLISFTFRLLRGLQTLLSNDDFEFVVFPLAVLNLADIGLVSLREEFFLA